MLSYCTYFPRSPPPLSPAFACAVSRLVFRSLSRSYLSFHSALDYDGISRPCICSAKQKNVVMEIVSELACAATLVPCQLPACVRSFRRRVNSDIPIEMHVTSRCAYSFRIGTSNTPTCGSTRAGSEKLSNVSCDLVLVTTSSAAPLRTALNRLGTRPFSEGVRVPGSESDESVVT